MKYFITEFLWNLIISEIIIYFITEFSTIDFERNSIWIINFWWIILKYDISFRSKI